MNDNELTTLDAVECEIRARYNGKYQSAPEYQASERETRKAITDILGLSQILERVTMF